MKAALLAASLLLAGGLRVAAAEEPPQGLVPLQQQGAGAYYARVSFANDMVADLLVDTGSSFVVLTTRTFKQLKKATPERQLRPLRKINASMAAGRPVSAQVYEIPLLVIGETCELHQVEVVVLPGAKRNILGLSALRRTGRFEMHFEPPALSLGDCQRPDAALAASWNDRRIDTSSPPHAAP